MRFLKNGLPGPVGSGPCLWLTGTAADSPSIPSHTGFPSLHEEADHMPVSALPAQLLWAPEASLTTLLRLPQWPLSNLGLYVHLSVFTIQL